MNAHINDVDQQYLSIRQPDNMLFKRTIKLIHRINTDARRRNGSHLAFIGVGNMGAKMATNLIKKGQPVKIYDVLPSNAQSVQGAEICDSPAAAAKDASIVITMLPNGDVVKAAVLGEKGVLKSMPKNALLIDSSTIEPKTAQELSKISNDNQVRFLDAPVSGGTIGAEAATLTFMVGGDAKDVKEAEPILLKMGARVFHCGEPGAGQVTKLCNNLILAITMIGTCEGMNMGIKLGLDPKILASVVNVSTGRSWSSDTYNPVPGLIGNLPCDDDYKGGFGVALVAKDLGLAESAALSCNAPVPLTAAAHQIYRMLNANGYGLKDFGVVYPFLKGNISK